MISGPPGSPPNPNIATPPGPTGLPVDGGPRPSVPRAPLRMAPDSFQRQDGPRLDALPLPTGPAFLGPRPVDGGPGRAAPMLLPDIQIWVDQVRNTPEPAQKARIVESQLNEHRNDPAWQSAFLLSVGTQDLVLALLAQDVSPSSFFKPSPHESARATLLLSEAARSLPPRELAQLIQAVGPERLLRMVEQGLGLMGNPFLIGSERFQQNLARFAEGLGRLVQAFGSNEASVQQLVKTLMAPGAREGGEPPRYELAGWLVARSGSDLLKRAFLDQHLGRYDAKMPFAEPLARALAAAMGSLEPPSVGLRLLVEMEGDTRRSFLADLLRPKYEAMSGVPLGAPDTGFQREIKRDVLDFLGKVARLHPSLHRGHEEDAASLRVEAFRLGVEALDDPFWKDDAGLKQALADLFWSDTDTIVDRLADPSESNPHFDPQGRLLAKFFREVALLNPEASSSRRALEAMQRYVGIGEKNFGLADILAASKGDPSFMASQGGEQMAAKLGFVLGAFRQGVEAALTRPLSDYERQSLVIVRGLGSLVEEALVRSPVSRAWTQARAGQGQHEVVAEVFGWLWETFAEAGTSPASPDDLQRFADRLLDGSMRPFFAAETRRGGDATTWSRLLGAINEGISAAATGGPVLQLSA
jgi:hypothetical protein